MSLADIPVDKTENLSRFILFSKWFRSDNTIKPDAFVPSPYVELSVTRQINISEIELWDLAKEVSVIRKCTLYGRADILAEPVMKQNLTIEPSEPPLNHANIKGYPEDKSKQKLIALELAAEASFIALG
jgi:hypothetical protein